VPDAEHASPFLDHDGVEEGGGGDPREESGVLHRIPGPIATPAQDLVAPPGAEDHADGQEPPGEQGPPPGVDEPSLADPTGNEAGAREGKWNREADQTEVQEWRVKSDQDVIL